VCPPNPNGSLPSALVILSVGRGPTHPFQRYRHWIYWALYCTHTGKWLQDDDKLMIAAIAIDACTKESFMSAAQKVWDLWLHSEPD